MKVDNIYFDLKKVVSDSIEENIASNGYLYSDVLGSRMDEFHNSWESSLDIKLPDFNSRLTSVFNIRGLPVGNVSVEDAEKNIDTAPSIEGFYSV